MTLLLELPPLSPDIHIQKITEYFASTQPKKPESKFRDLSLSDLRGAYFLCFVNRCGSNLLAQSIASNRSLVQAREYLNFDAVIEQSQKFGFSSFKEYFYWLANATKGEKGIFGCKASAEQILFLYNEDLLSQFPKIPQFIHILRRDIIAQAVSLYIAKKTNQWASIQPTNDVPITYDKNELVALVGHICSRNAAFECLFQLFGVSPLVVYYEDFVGKPRKWIRRIGDFLGIEGLSYVKQAIKYTRQADRRNDDLISQFRQEFKL